MKKLPNKFEAIVFAAAPWSANYCYALESITGLHFYLKSPKLHEQLRDSQFDQGSKQHIPIVLHKKSFIFFNIHIAYDKNGNKIGEFSGPAGGGPAGNFYKDVWASY